jgi:hypothetical protein
MKATCASLWLIALTVLWPGLHFLVFFVRFGRPPSGGFTDALVFLPMGLVAAVILIVLWARAGTRLRKVGLVLGYLLASPVAFIGSLMSGLMLPPVVGTLLYGAGPLVVGMLIGYALAEKKPTPQGALTPPSAPRLILSAVVWVILFGLLAIVAGNLLIYVAIWYLVAVTPADDMRRKFRMVVAGLYCLALSILYFYAASAVIEKYGIHASRWWYASLGAILAYLKLALAIATFAKARTLFTVKGLDAYLAKRAEEQAKLRPVDLSQLARLDLATVAENRVLPRPVTVKRLDAVTGEVLFDIRFRKGIRYGVVASAGEAYSGEVIICAGGNLFRVDQRALGE